MTELLRAGLTAFEPAPRIEHPMGDNLPSLINKRLTLNLLIQGAATHTFLSAHYLVADDLNTLNPKLLALYDKLAVAGFLSYWHGDLSLLQGHPERFWQRVKNGAHPFSTHPLLAKHGGILARASKEHADARAVEKGVSPKFAFHFVKLAALTVRIAWHENGNENELAEIAIAATEGIWGIDPDRLRGQITYDVECGEVRTPETFVGRMFRRAAAGWSCVERDGDRLIVVARATCWPLLLHELVKGVAELVCLHGLNKLDRETYDKVIEATDHIEYEPWMMQAGSELWRRYLKLKPTDRTLAESLMQVARLPPKPLEQMMMAVVEDAENAKEWLASL
jgi:hypothetical protein